MQMEKNRGDDLPLKREVDCNGYTLTSLAAKMFYDRSPTVENHSLHGTHSLKAITTL